MLDKIGFDRILAEEISVSIEFHTREGMEQERVLYNSNRELIKGDELESTWGSSPQGEFLTPRREGKEQHQEQQIKVGPKVFTPASNSEARPHNWNHAHAMLPSSA